jgi:hypothetical protein
MPREDEEYELIPMSPLRRLEKRISKIEDSPEVDSRDFFKELAEIVRMNQQIVDEMAKANDALRIEISKLPAKMDDLISQLSELISFVKASATEEPVHSETSLKPLLEKMDALIDGNKKMAEGIQSTLTSVEEVGDKIKSHAIRPPLRRMMPPQPQRI